MTTGARVRVWDRFVRVFHWCLVASFFTAYFSTTNIQTVHKYAGYVALGLVAARVIWGFIGSQHARFAGFVPSPRGLWNYLRALVRGREGRHLGHNPAGAVMILLLLAMVAGIGTTGWMLTTDAFWGSEPIETVHVLLTDVMLVAVAIHVTANVFMSIRHRENLVVSMVTGYKYVGEGTESPPGGPTPSPATRTHTGADIPVVGPMVKKSAIFAAAVSALMYLFAE
jgi:cytochrome b